MSDPDLCLFCQRSSQAPVDVLPSNAKACHACVSRLGTLLLEQDLAVAAIWPALRHQVEEEGDEPIVRLPDGRVVELRERTAELKEQLSLEKRAALARTYVEIGMYREAVMEAALVLSQSENSQALAAALEVLLTPPLGRPRAAESVRVLLRPN